jgi:hypothetical protein
LFLPALLSSLAGAPPAAELIERGRFAEELEGDLAAAIQAYAAALADPAAAAAEQNRARYFLSRCHRKRGDLDAARAALAGWRETPGPEGKMERDILSFLCGLRPPDPAALTPATALAYFEIVNPADQLDRALGAFGLTTTNVQSILRELATADESGQLAAALVQPFIIPELQKVERLALAVFAKSPPVDQTENKNELPVDLLVFLVSTNTFLQERALQATFAAPAGAQPRTNELPTAVFRVRENLVLYGSFTPTLALLATSTNLLDDARRRRTNNIPAGALADTPAFRSPAARAYRATDAVHFWLNLSTLADNSRDAQTNAPSEKFPAALLGALSFCSNRIALEADLLTSEPENKAASPPAPAAAADFSSNISATLKGAATNRPPPDAFGFLRFGVRGAPPALPQAGNNAALRRALREILATALQWQTGQAAVLFMTAPAGGQLQSPVEAEDVCRLLKIVSLPLDPRAELPGWPALSLADPPARGELLGGLALGPLSRLLLSACPVADQAPQWQRLLPALASALDKTRLRLIGYAAAGRRHISARLENIPNLEKITVVISEPQTNSFRIPDPRLETAQIRNSEIYFLDCNSAPPRLCARYSEFLDIKENSAGAPAESEK